MVTATSRSRQFKKWPVVAGAVALAFVVAAWLSNGALARMVRERMIQGLRQSFASDLEFKNLEVAVFPQFHANGEALVFRFKGRKDLPPLISLRRFTVNSGLLHLLAGHIGQVRLEGLEIQIPPKQERGPQEQTPASQTITGFVMDDIVADGTILKTLPKDSGREPLVWEIRRLRLKGGGPSLPMSFRATLVNAKPPGEIESSGKFGPWLSDEPGGTQVSGDYTFRNANLSVFRGIAGTLSSEGKYRGVLRRIEIQGNTDTPNFAVEVSGNPVHLKTQFQAVVDGTDGDTYLQPVNAQFGRSSVVARGAIEGRGGVNGKTISLDVTVEQGRLEDMLRLGVKGSPAMSGVVSFQTKLVIPPGDVDIAQKIKLDGEFRAAAARFSHFDVQQKVNKLSHSGRGDPKTPSTDSVASDFAGWFKLNNSVMNFRSLSFRVPGVRIALNGRYGLMDQEMEFHGTAKLEAKLSQTTTGFKSFLLKAVDPFFRKKDAGAVIPIKITGKRDQPSFGLDLAR
jgi:hypothetical protein